MYFQCIWTQVLSNAGLTLLMSLTCVLISDIESIWKSLGRVPQFASFLTTPYATASFCTTWSLTYLTRFFFSEQFWGIEELKFFQSTWVFEDTVSCHMKRNPIFIELMQQPTESKKTNRNLSPQKLQDKAGCAGLFLMKWDFRSETWDFFSPTKNPHVPPTDPAW